LGKDLKDEDLKYIATKTKSRDIGKHIKMDSIERGKQAKRDKRGKQAKRDKRGKQAKRNEKLTNVTPSLNQTTSGKSISLKKEFILNQVITETAQTLTTTPHQHQTPPCQLTLNVPLGSSGLIKILAIRLLNPSQVFSYQLPQPQLQQSFSDPLRNKGRGDLLSAVGQKEG
jgi:hypothetical protein